jgi:hypothetical protein
MLYTGRKITTSFVDTWEGGGDRKTIAQRERERNLFIVLYDMKQLGSGCRL